MESDFGKGLTYCLGLFLKHADQYDIDKKSYEINKDLIKIIDTLPRMWFNGASDHLYDLQIPDSFSDKLKKRLKDFQNKVLDFGHGYLKEVKEIDIIRAIEECKLLLIEIDNTLGVETIKGEWE